MGTRDYLPITLAGFVHPNTFALGVCALTYGLDPDAVDIKVAQADPWFAVAAEAKANLDNASLYSRPMRKVLSVVKTYTPNLSAMSKDWRTKMMLVINSMIAMVALSEGVHDRSSLPSGEDSLIRHAKSLAPVLVHLTADERAQELLSNHTDLLLEAGRVAAINQMNKGILGNTSKISSRLARHLILDSEYEKELESMFAAMKRAGGFSPNIVEMLLGRHYVIVGHQSSRILSDFILQAKDLHLDHMRRQMLDSKDNYNARLVWALVLLP